jgi:DNA-binding beta-propeller fold protein YncE
VRFSSAWLVVVFAAGCNRSGTQSGLHGVASISGMASDPARERIYLADATAGRILVFSATNGAKLREVALGASIGGIALDHCMERLFVSVTGANRIDTYDLDTFARVGALRIDAPPFALASIHDDHLAVVASTGLFDLDPATGILHKLQATVSTDALLASNRAGDVLWLADSVEGSTEITRFDLTQAGIPTVQSQTHAIPGTPVGLALSYAGDQLFAAADGSGDVFVLDAATLAIQDVVSTNEDLAEVGTGLAAFCLNATSTRLYFTHGDPAIESVNLDQRAPGAVHTASQDVVPRGLMIGANGLTLLTHESDRSVRSYSLFDVQLNGPGAVRQTRTYTATIDGAPNANYWVFASGDPGYIYLDPPTSVDPRFFDLALGAGFRVIGFGNLGPSGHASLSGTVPDTFTEEATVILQVAVQEQPGRNFTEISNPLVTRALTAECSK